MTRPTAFGAECEHGSLARSCDRCDDARELAALRVANEMRLATIADLRDRLRVLAPMVCEGCGCEPARESLCEDCYRCAWLDEPEDLTDEGRAYYAAACLSAGLRALCGRRLLDGCDTTKGGE